MEVEEGFIDINGTKVFHRKKVLVGNKKNIALFHGYSFTSMDWDRADLFSNYSKVGYNVYAPDYPGFGRSSGSERYGIARGDLDHAALFIHDYLKANGIDRSVILGASMGGGMVLMTALQYPEMIEGVIAVAPAWVESMRDDLKRITQKTLLVWGSKDHVVPISLSREYASIIPGSRLEIVDGSGHPVYIEKPDEFVRITVDFLKSL
ncbi:alpha/beta fold hydrolase [Thermoplasma sp.]|uniref:alpha/beta fold hydrolase n=1 Tax=Thermoplasma sp. TaxID=1973142 RepID=UPI0012750D13|nr:alpha/beta hydrolase [Thermoplasma sp.]KAA8922623.1 MAG: alpha/beta hydrolase [Thermoplasma sp.]